jgi:hypothetical protein
LTGAAVTEHRDCTLRHGANSRRFAVTRAESPHSLGAGQRKSDSPRVGGGSMIPNGPLGRRQQPFIGRVDDTIAALEAWFKPRGLRLMGSVLLATVLLSIPTALRSPIAWQDESQIADSGRVLVSGDTTHGLSLLAAGEALVTPFGYGPVLVELLYRFGGHHGIRIGMSFLGAVFALLLFMIGRRTLNGDALLPAVFSLTFFFSHSFSQNVRGGRVDVFAFVLIALALLLVTDDPSGLKWGRVAVGSALVGIGAFTWVTSSLLAPLWLVMVLKRLDSVRNSGLKATVGLAAAALVPAAVMAAGAIFMALHAGSGDLSLAALIESLRGQSLRLSGGGVTAEERVRVLIAQVLRDAPMYILFVLIVFARRRRPSKAPAGAFVSLVTAVLAIVFITNPYIHRYIYFAAATAIASMLLLPVLAVRTRRTVTAMLLIVLPALAVLQIVVRPILALADEDRSFAAAEEAVDGVMCRQADSVYLDVWRFYFILRDRDCRSERLFLADKGEVEAHLLASISDYDYIVLSGMTSDWPVSEHFRSEGWTVEERGQGSHYRSPIVVLQAPPTDE